eukprot:Amastigsp_a175723_107.p6 type:complete len:100 gc:universal Amastigsp_a175723_107:966-1265(+)
MPSGRRVVIMPLSTVESAVEEPRILATRTLSTLNSFGLAGITIAHASATRAARRSSCPYCFDASTVLIDDASDARSLKLTACGSARVSRISMAFAAAFS